jgi:hypothetical protein
VDLVSPDATLGALFSSSLFKNHLTSWHICFSIVFLIKLFLPYILVVWHYCNIVWTGTCSIMKQSLIAQPLNELPELNWQI